MKDGLRNDWRFGEQLNHTMHVESFYKNLEIVKENYNLVRPYGGLKFSRVLFKLRIVFQTDHDLLTSVSLNKRWQKFTSFIPSV